jgi:hypothetical protein
MVTTAYRVLKLEHCIAALALLPVLWAFGHVTPAILPASLAALHTGALQNEALITILVWQATAIAAALVLGFVAAFFARSLGHEALRTLLSPSQAQLFALLATATLWIAATGLNWAAYKQDEILTIIWYVLTGAAQLLFGAIWLLLAARAASSLRQFSTALNLFVAAEGCFLSALGGLMLLILLFYDGLPDPSLAMFGLFVLVGIALTAVPSALAVTAGAALWSGILAYRDSAFKRGSGADSPSQED